MHYRSLECETDVVSEMYCVAVALAVVLVVHSLEDQWVTYTQ